MFPIWSKLPSSFLFQCWYQAGTWFPPGVCCTFLERGEKKNICYCCLGRKCCEALTVTQVCRTCFIQLLFFPVELCGRIPRPHIPSSPSAQFCPLYQPFAWGPEQSSNRTSLCFQVLKRVLWPTLASCLCSSPPATAGAIRIPSFSPPARSGIAEPPSLPLLIFLLPPFLLPFCPSASIDVAVES